MPENVPDWVAQDYLFEPESKNISIDDEFPDYGVNCETDAFAVDRNETTVLIDNTWQKLE